ncbi:MAG: isoprenylcysteine carboxylmethyltransferase family protein [Albidovulum sp.]
MAKDVDFPPVWLAGFAAAGGLIGRIWPIETEVNLSLGLVLIVLGAVLVVIAVLQMMFARTSIIPRRDPDALVMNGLFRLSRNPIYLGDALILTGLYLSWDALIALPLVAVFMVVITQRFILGEEARLQAHFGEAFEAYCARVRRWI